MTNTPFIQAYPNLCKPIRIGNLILRSRMCSAPMGFPDLTEDGLLTRDAIAFYELRAKGGAAIVTISEALTHGTGKSHGRIINLENQSALPGLTNAARAIKRHGALASIELNHSGKYSDMDILNEERVNTIIKYGPSEEILPNGKKVAEMPKDLIADIVKSFGRGAMLCKRAGFDMVMIHGAHGWLIEQFLSPASNRRTDEYGGNLRNRARLAVEIIDAVRTAVGPGFPIEFRMSAVENIPGGYGLEDAVEFAKLIEDKINLLHVSAGSGEENFSMTHPPMFVEPGINVRYAAEIKKHVHVPIATVGALNEPDQMEEIIASGKADVVCMARALLADPRLPMKVEQNRTDEILRCLRCFTCHAERMLTQTRICAVNPVIGREYESRFALPPAKPKRVLVAGGGPAGLQCALTAADRGHNVVLCEQSGELGGALRCERYIPFKEAMPKYIRTMARRLAIMGVEVRLNTPVDADFVRDFVPDVLIVAVGAEPIVPSIPGIDSRKVIVANDLAEKEGDIGKRVAVLGGGLVGCEAAVHLAQRGHTVTVVEMQDKVAGDANPRHRPILLKLLYELADVRTGLRGIAVTEEGLLCADAEDKPAIFPADTVLCAVGQRPLRALVNTLRGTAPKVETVGDCITARNIREATFRGYHAALDI